MLRTPIKAKSGPTKCRKTTFRTNTGTSARTTDNLPGPSRLDFQLENSSGDCGLICRSPCRDSVAFEFLFRRSLLAAFDLDAALEKGAVLDADAGGNHVAGH